MSLRLNNLKSLGTQIAITVPKDNEGFLGRECPDSACIGYFKIKPGTGLSGSDLPCYCAYCGHVDSHDAFYTKEQIEYGKSVVINKVARAVQDNLKSLEFERKPHGPFGIGLSMRVKPGRMPPLRHYREKTLETKISCNQCTLEYSVYGVFAYCPDCGVHNSLQMLSSNLDLVERQLRLAENIQECDMQRHLIEDALENCVSSVDGFAREAVRIRANRSTDSKRALRFSFQNLKIGSKTLDKLFGIDLEAQFDQEEWDAANIQFMKRHILAHKAGVIDQKFVDETGAGKVGSRVLVTADDVRKCASFVNDCGQKFNALLPAPMP